jgi:hypothetical protein
MIALSQPETRRFTHQAWQNEIARVTVPIAPSLRADRPLRVSLIGEIRF